MGGLMRMLRRCLLWLVSTEQLVEALTERRDFIGTIACCRKLGLFDELWTWRFCRLDLIGKGTREDLYAVMDEAYAQAAAVLPSSLPPRPPAAEGKRP